MVIWCILGPTWSHLAWSAFNIFLFFIWSSLLTCIWVWLVLCRFPTFRRHFTTHFFNIYSYSAIKMLYYWPASPSLCQLKCRPLLQLSWHSVVCCLGVCRSWLSALQKRLNRQGCRLGCRFGWPGEPKEQCIRWRYSMYDRHIANATVRAVLGGDVGCCYTLL